MRRRRSMSRFPFRPYLVDPRPPFLCATCPRRALLASPNASSLGWIASWASSPSATKIIGVSVWPTIRYGILILVRGYAMLVAYLLTFARVCLVIDLPTGKSYPTARMTSPPVEYRTNKHLGSDLASSRAHLLQ